VSVSNKVPLAENSNVDGVKKLTSVTLELNIRLVRWLNTLCPDWTVYKSAIAGIRVVCR
jgi:hypothetical protein